VSATGILGIVFIVVGIVYLISPKFLYYLRFGSYGQICKAGLKGGAVATRNKRLAFILIGCFMLIAGVFFLAILF